MGGGLEIIILAMVAGFIALRLVSVLGRRTDDEPRRENPYNMNRRGEAPQQDQSPVVQDSGYAGLEPPVGIVIDPHSPLGRTLGRIRSADRNFDVDSFVSGASSAYEMIIESFAAGDRDTLKPLLDDDVFAGFDAAIAEREAENRFADTKIVDILSAEITDAAFDDGVAEVTVTFKSEMISVIRDEEGRILEGNPSDTVNVTDIWTFARQVKSRDPNWLLVSTEHEG